MGAKKGRGRGPLPKNRNTSRGRTYGTSRQHETRCDHRLYFTNTLYLAPPTPGYPRLGIAASS